tara:strand:- start:2646 stop:3068 length:423 start_codon:yes stop_codon:yes gene_type:complete
MVTMKTRITATGPLFKDPSSVIRKGVRGIVQAVVEAGEQRLDTTLRPRPRGVYLSVSEAKKGQHSTGHYRRNVHGKVTNLHGRIDDGGVVYGPWLEGVDRRNLTTRFKGYASFRRTSQWLVKNFKRIAGPRIQRLIKDLG